MQYTISQLRMEAPCGQSWEGMTPTERGRFCAECKLEVVDFTRLSNAQILEYFEKYQKGQTRICGRMQTERLQGGMALAARKLGLGLLAGLAVLTTGCEWFSPSPPPPAGGMVFTPDSLRVEQPKFATTINGQLPKELANMSLLLTATQTTPESVVAFRLNDAEGANGVQLTTDATGRFETKGFLLYALNQSLLSPVLFEFQIQPNSNKTYSIRAAVTYDTSSRTATANIVAKEMKALQSSE
jgi:hypothetical protein